MKSVTAFAPATTSNLAVGFDVLGFPIEGLGDTLTLSPRRDSTIHFEHINDPLIPQKPERNVASMVVMAMREHYGLSHGFSLSLDKGIPLGSGLGGSAASAVAAAVAMTGFIDAPVSLDLLCDFALNAEAQVSGGVHGDNVVPCVMGGFCLISSLTPLRVTQLPRPDMQCLFVHPHLSIETKMARGVLKKNVPLHTVIKQTANLATFISALYENNLDKLSEACQDELIEPWRHVLIPGFHDVKKAALEAGALACSISGSGPTLFAFTKKQHAESIGKSMQNVFKKQGLDSDVYLSAISSQGARIL